MLHTAKGTASLIKKDIFKNLMWYMLPDSSKQYPVTIVRVKEIVRMNAKGERPDELEAIELVGGKPKEIEPTFVDVVGQISLRSLERNSKKRKDKENDHRGSWSPPGSDTTKKDGQPNAPAVTKKDSQPPRGQQPAKAAPQQPARQPQKEQRDRKYAAATTARAKKRGQPAT